jgi:hypothetical protein
MAFLVLSGLAFLTSFVLHWLKGWSWLSILAPVVTFIAFLLFDAYVLPYRGGGASMWPIAVMFGSPIALLGAIFGVVVARSLKTRGRDNAL